MSMPLDLVLVRHGQSEGNVATHLSHEGDNSWYDERFAQTPGHQWRLTAKGVKQAETTGKWIADNIGAFEGFFVSPYVRTRETAAHLNLADASWRLNRAFRERDWGDIGNLPKDEFANDEAFKLSYIRFKTDPLYWAPPNGESIAQVAEDRVRNILDTLHREHSSSRVVAVTHGDLMSAFRLVLERLDDDTYIKMKEDKSFKIKNAGVLHYSRMNPYNNKVSKRLSWVRKMHPIVDDETGEVVVHESGWREITFARYTNTDLLASVEHVPSLDPNARATS